MNNGIGQHHTHETNPFRIDNKNIVTKNRVSDGITVGRDYYDIQKYSVRIFPEMLPDVLELSAMGIKILVYIFSEIRKNTDEVYFNIDDFIKFVEKNTGKRLKSRAGIYRGVEDLLSRELIARKSKDNRKYYINPSKFYVGSRVEYYFKSKPQEVNETLNQQQ